MLEDFSTLFRCRFAHFEVKKDVDGAANGVVSTAYIIGIKLLGHSFVQMREREGGERWVDMLAIGISNNGRAVRG